MCLELQIIFLQKCYYHNVEVLPKLKNMLQKKKHCSTYNCSIR
jgi:hypothetical protein